MELPSAGNHYSCREVYEEGADLLKDLDDGRLDARLLLEHFCGIETHRLLADPEHPVAAADREAFLDGIRRRAAREPLAYITGEQSFMGLPFVVSPDVLIPEQDTENLVEEAMRYLDDGSRILDLCTGSGCILLSLLHYSNGCIGIGTDLSPGALRIAQTNARALGLEERVKWLQGDLFRALECQASLPAPDPGEALLRYGIEGIVSECPEEGAAAGLKELEPGVFGREEPAAARTAGFPAAALTGTADLSDMKFDLIVSNPPYIPSSVIETLAPEVRCSEPRMALDGGSDGLDFYRRIISEAPDHLVIGGRLMLEIGYDQGAAVSALLEEAGYYGIEIIRDYGGNDRVATATRSMSRLSGKS